MTRWNDCTSYQRGQERIPTTWELRLPDLRIVVLTGHRACPDRWVMHCAPWFDTHDIGLADWVEAEDAQKVALAKVTAKVAAIKAALDEATP